MIPLMKSVPVRCCLHYSIFTTQSAKIGLPYSFYAMLFNISRIETDDEEFSMFLFPLVVTVYNFVCHEIVSQMSFLQADF